MRIRGAKAVHYDSGPNMTPLVDVVMVILIFLMLAGSFGGVEHYLVSSTPVTKTGGGANTSVVPDEVQYTITVDSPMGLSDRFVVRAGDLVTSDMDKLTAALVRKRKEFNAAGTATDKVQVIVAPGRTVKYKFLIDVYQAALSAEFTKVSFQQAH
ncbi:MAG TPA: biopolymer transporter ExbD [Tepidisphaeraceae bacterium]|nr:biopolymer transporter ExbD [Tepidisphaeraceae bacterium]